MRIDDQKQAATKQLAVYWTQAQPAVFSFICALIPSFHDAQDVLQRVAVVLVEKFDQYDPQRRFVDWAIGIARYEVLKYQRRVARDRQVFQQEATIDALVEAYAASQVPFNALHQALGKCLTHLKDRDRRLLRMWYAQEAGPEKIMQALGVAKKTVYVLLHRLRRSLRACVERRLDGAVHL